MELCRCKTKDEIRNLLPMDHFRVSIHISILFLVGGLFYGWCLVFTYSPTLTLTQDCLCEEWKIGPPKR